MPQKELIQTKKIVKNTIEPTKVNTFLQTIRNKENKKRYNSNPPIFNQIK
jgi:hypothetical protein